LGYGNVVEVQHAEGFSTRYAHLSKRLVQPGDQVERGGVLGEVGSTGRSTGPHLHYEVFSKDRVINPVQVLLIGSN
jgi:murein DD-endopeptidase MepM/ murein hydrolase activator NlpD